MISTTSFRSALALAAAATAIMMDEACCEVTEEPKEFIANEPFRFYICGGENDSEVLFSGQIVK